MRPRGIQLSAIMGRRSKRTAAGTPWCCAASKPPRWSSGVLRHRGCWQPADK